MTNIKRLIDLLLAHNLTLATAESCTGGLISYQLTEQPGSSAYFMGAIVAYDNAVKQKLLLVREATLVNYGAVSAQCAEEMVFGVCSALKTQCGIAVTGIAGPAGGTADKPVGLVYISVKVMDNITVKEFRLEGTRQDIRNLTAQHAIELLIEELAKL